MAETVNVPTAEDLAVDLRRALHVCETLDGMGFNTAESVITLAAIRRALHAEAECARLREALNPFARQAPLYSGCPDDMGVGEEIKLADCRKAWEVLGE